MTKRQLLQCMNLLTPLFHDYPDKFLKIQIFLSYQLSRLTCGAPRRHAETRQAKNWPSSLKPAGKMPLHCLCGGLLLDKVNEKQRFSGAEKLVSLYGKRSG